MEKIQKGIERALFYCLGLKKYERLLIVTDDILGNLANLFYEVARKHQIDAAVLKIPAVGMDGSEPPAIVADALHHVDVALIITRYSMTHTRAREKATHRGTPNCLFARVYQANVGWSPHGGLRRIETTVRENESLS